MTLCYQVRCECGGTFFVSKERVDGLVIRVRTHNASTGHDSTMFVTCPHCQVKRELRGPAEDIVAI